MAVSLKKEGKFKEAVEACENEIREMRLSESLGFEEGGVSYTIKTYLKIVPYYQKAGQSDKAIAFAKELLKDCWARSEHIVYSAIALVYERDKNYPMAFYHYQVANLFLRKTFSDRKLAFFEKRGIDKAMQSELCQQAKNKAEEAISAPKLNKMAQSQLERSK